VRPPGGLTPEVAATSAISSPQGSTGGARAASSGSSGGGSAVCGGPGDSRAGLRCRNDGGGFHGGSGRRFRTDRREPFAESHEEHLKRRLSRQPRESYPHPRW